MEGFFHANKSIDPVHVAFWKRKIPKEEKGSFADMINEFRGLLKPGPVVV